MSVVVRSVLFNLLFYVNLFVHMVVALPTLLLPRRILWMLVRSYGRVSLWLLRVICGVGVEWRGLENIPPGAALIASKHQSLWETFALLLVLDEPLYIVKRELMWIPLFGWFAWKCEMIPVDRGARSQALASMTVRAREALARGRKIIIFPEGTRRAPGAEPKYKYGVVHLYAETGAPCLPIALNSGLYWPRRTLWRYPGTVRVEILPPITPGMDKDTFASHLQRTIEDATARLVAEGEKEMGRAGVSSETAREAAQRAP